MDQDFKPGIIYTHGVLLCCDQVKLPNLKLKTQPKQLLGSQPLDIALPVLVYP
jgi:hypothetical protein